MRLPSASLLLTLSLGACASISPPEGLERIVYDPQPPPFCGACETRTITVAADDTVWIEDGHWAGDYSNWTVRRRRLAGEPGTYARLRDALAPYRPATERLPTFAGEGCEHYLTDNGGAVITWSGVSGAVRRILDHGCLDDRAMNDAIEAAVAQAPVGR